MSGNIGHINDMGMGSMMVNMQQHMGGQMSEATKAYMQVMATMHQPKMEDAMAQDPDVAFNCSTIAHHLGAIAMARSPLQPGKDEASRKMAQSTVDGQSKEIEEMNKWVEVHTKD